MALLFRTFLKGTFFSIKLISNYHQARMTLKSSSYFGGANLQIINKNSIK